METYTYTKESLEETADVIKVAVIRSLVTEGYLTGDDWADEWCKTHTVIFRKKTIFQTISNLWKSENEVDQGFVVLVVKQVVK